MNERMDLLEKDRARTLVDRAVGLDNPTVLKRYVERAIGTHDTPAPQFPPILIPSAVSRHSSASDLTSPALSTRVVPPAAAAISAPPPIAPIVQLTTATP